MYWKENIFFKTYIIVMMTQFVFENGKYLGLKYYERRNLPYASDQSLGNRGVLHGLNG